MKQLDSVQKHATENEIELDEQKAKVILFAFRFYIFHERLLLVERANEHSNKVHDKWDWYVYLDNCPFHFLLFRDTVISEAILCSYLRGFVLY